VNSPTLDHWEPPPGALEDYLRYWGPTSDAPRIYHIACGLVALAGTVENRVYLQFGGDRIYPNLFALILGPSSFYRKSSSLAKAKRTLKDGYEGDGPGPVLPDEFSREALLKVLSERAQGVLTYSEFSGTLANFGRDYMSGTVQLLADLYDSPVEYKRVIGAQSFTLRNCCLSILAASQTDWFVEKVKASDMRGGFLARFTFWPAFTKSDFLAVPPAPDSALGNRLQRRLTAIRALKGAVSLEPAAATHYTRWVEIHERELNDSPYVADLSPFWSRLSITTLKLAMLLEMSHRVDLRIGVDALRQAITIAEFLKSSLRALFQQEFAFTQPMKDRQKILRLVLSRPGISRRDLLRASSMLVRPFEDVLRTLTQEDSIVLRDGHYFATLDDAAAVSSGAVSTGTTDTRRPMMARVR
jgi:hypothetical protein